MIQPPIDFNLLRVSRDRGGFKMAATSVPGSSCDCNAVADVKVGKRQIRVREFDDGIFGDVHLIFLRLAGLRRTTAWGTCAARIAAATAPSGVAASSPASAARVATTVPTTAALTTIAAVAAIRVARTRGVNIPHRQPLLLRIGVRHFGRADDLGLISAAFVL